MIPPWRSRPVTGLWGHRVVPPCSRTGRRVLVTTRNACPCRHARVPPVHGVADERGRASARAGSSLRVEGRSGSDNRDARPSRGGCKEPRRRLMFFLTYSQDPFGRLGGGRGTAMCPPLRPGTRPPAGVYTAAASV